MMRPGLMAVAVVVGRRALVRMMPMALRRREVLLHHRPAIFVPHDLLVGHAVALAHGALREILARGVVAFAVMAGLFVAVMARRPMVWACVPAGMRASAVVRVMLPRRPRGIMRERGQRLA